MRNFLRRLLKALAYVAGGIVILLAIAVGLFRMFLPKLPEYQDDIKGWASDAIGMTVEFSGMDVRWGLSGPEVEFYDAELLLRDTSTRFVAAEEVSVGLGLTRLITDRKRVVDHLAIRNTSIEVRQLDNGEWWIQGGPLDQLFPNRRGGGTGEGIGNIDIVGEDIELLFQQAGQDTPKRFHVSRMLATSDDERVAIDAVIELPAELGRRMTVTATQLRTGPIESGRWNISAAVDDVQLGGVMAMQPIEAARFDAGGGDMDLSFAIANKRVTSATADVELGDIAIAGMSDMAVSGRFEFLWDDDGWLVAASGLRARTPAGEWPESSLRFEAGVDEHGKIVLVDIQASFLDLSQAGIVLPWLDEANGALLNQFDPSGTLRDVSLSMSDFGSDVPRFDLSATFDDLGIAAHEKRPGVRGFSGSIRADHSGGRLEINADDLAVTAAGVLGETLVFDETLGTVLWRRSDNRTTVLSDSIVLRNAFFDSETSVEFSFVGAGESPRIDLESDFTVSDVSQARRYVPFMPKRPRMSRWFHEGLVAGRVSRGHAQLSGPLDQFPFRNGEGLLLIEGTVNDGIIVYQPKWPVAEVIEAEIVVENMSLRSERSRILNAGNEIVDAKLEIANFRQPILTLDARANGTLETFRQLSVQSPIGEMLGGQLDRVTVSGDATASLDLRVPIRDWESFSFTTRLQTSNGSLQFEGFPAPLTELAGIVVIERENIGSEALGGRFLGHPVTVELSQAPETMPEYRVIAHAQGTAAVDAIESEMGLPVRNRASGETAYTARMLFPRGQAENPKPFTIEVDTDLSGVEIDLPRPLGKTAAEAIGVRANIHIPKGGEQVETTGHMRDIGAWRVNFTKGEAWDLDRGIAEFGTDEVSDTVVAETRGLHLRGTTEYVRAQDWFDLARDSESEYRLGERIRSIDLTVGNLHILGQHLVDHHFHMDRSADEWIVQLDGDNVSGSVFVPYDFNSGKSIVVNAERLLLPGDEEEEGREKLRVDPRNLPPISISAGAMAFGNRNFGAVEADFARTADGLVASEIIAKDDTFEIVGNGGWTIDETDPMGSRSAIIATLTSTNVAATMSRLGYAPGIRGEKMSMLLDLGWSGGPSDDMLESLDGDVKVRIGEGQLSDVKPGAGRVFGLLSIAALPRRLALDFRDVFGKGFAFDKITGDFVITDGETHTCNLSLEGPAADIGIVGRAGLVSREYEQSAVVSANFGNALPVAGALVAGPQVAAALLIFSRIFKKPLQEVTQIYYGISGSFDEPAIETLSAEEFAASGLIHGCIAEGGES